MFSMAPQEVWGNVSQTKTFPFLENWVKKIRFFGGGFRQVCQNCNLRVQRNFFGKVFLSRKLSSTFSLIGEGNSACREMFSADPLKVCLCVNSILLGRNWFCWKTLEKSRRMCRNVFGFLTTQFPRNVKSCFHLSCPKQILRSFFGKRLFPKQFWTFSRKIEEVWQM